MRVLLLALVAVAGLIGAIVFGLHGLTSGSSGELDRILALGCVFGVAASALGIKLDDGIRTRIPAVLTRDERIQLTMAVPLVMLMLSVFLLTLIPSIYVMLPMFAVWHRAARPRETPPVHAPEPAFAH